MLVDAEADEVRDELEGPERAGGELVGGEGAVGARALRGGLDEEREGGRGIEYLGSVFGIGEGVDDAIYDTAVRNELVVVGLKEVRT